MLKIKDIRKWAEENDLTSLVRLIDKRILEKKIKEDDDEIKLWMLERKASWYGDNKSNKVCKCLPLNISQENLEGTQDHQYLYQIAKEYLSEIYNNAKAKSVFLHPDVARDLLANKFKNQYFNGNYIKAKKWASDFVFLNLPLSGIILDEERAKASECHEVKGKTFTKGIVGALNKDQITTFCLKGKEYKGIYEDRQKLYNIGVKCGLHGTQLTDFVDFYIKSGLSMYDDSYINEWAERFYKNNEWDYSDLTRRKILHEINPIKYK